MSTSPSIVPADDPPTTKNTWVKIGKLLLTDKHKSTITNGKQLTDIHISAAQSLLKINFAHLNALMHHLVWITMIHFTPKYQRMLNTL